MKIAPFSLPSSCPSAKARRDSELAAGLIARRAGTRLTAGNLKNRVRTLLGIIYLTNRNGCDTIINMQRPKNLRQAIIHFADADNCLKYMVARRWPDGVECPTCGRKDPVFLANQRKWQCKSVHPKRQFSAKVGTIFEDSPLGLDKWLPAVWMLTSDKNGISSYEVGRALGVTQKTAWFMLHRIRLAMQADSLLKIGGPGSEVEVDETYIGGKARNMHEWRKRKVLEGKAGGAVGKVAVQGLLERRGVVRVRVVGDAKRKALVKGVRMHIKPGTNVYTDDAAAYYGMKGFVHRVINHAKKYVDGRVHTNSIENFWSLVKRTLGGTYISVEPFHLFRYLDEQAFRYNNRKDEDGDSGRFRSALSRIVGKRFTYAELTGKEGAAAF